MSRLRSLLRTWPQEPRRQKNQDAVEAVQGCVMQLVREGVLGVAAVPGTVGVLVLTSVAIHVLLDAKDAPGVLPDALDVMITVQPPAELNAEQHALLIVELGVHPGVWEDVLEHVLDVVTHVSEHAEHVVQDAVNRAEHHATAIVDHHVQHVLDVLGVLDVDMDAQSVAMDAIQHVTDVMVVMGVVQVVA